MGKSNCLAIAAAFIGGAIVGATAGLLLAPEKGEDTRKKVREALEKSGIKLDKADLEALVTRVKNAVTSSDDEIEDEEQEVGNDNA